jgi:glycosyltransferase involved in cell wall biosynthesis
MNILHVNKYYPPLIGGIETIVAEIAEMLQSESVNNRVLVCQDTKAPTKTENQNGVEIIRAKTFCSLLGMPISTDFFLQFKNQVSKTDIIVIHHPFPLGFLAAALLAKKKRIVVIYHADIVRQKCFAFLLKPIFHLILSRASDIIVTSDRLSKSSPLLKPFLEKCTTMPLWIDEEKFIKTETVQKTAEEIKSQYPKPLLLSVGRLVSYKGYRYLIDALTKTSGHLLFIGTGPLKQKLLQQIQRNKLEDRITILNPVENLSPYYYAADLFILPSITNAEAFGIVQLEALYCGCPVINTSLPTGVPEVSLHNQTGFTVEPKNVQELEQAINTLIENPNLRKRFSEQAHKRALIQFSKKHSFEILNSILFKKTL